ncbi:arsenate reductase ArsC [Streptococcus suis]|nr:arsenate reductase ArsC [Streptococcus suis]WNO78785.1 arsenate reductase ArsC [Streptococcus suis]CAI3412556.1 arsenate reductase ArsC [Enterococcus cecorum]
MMPKPKVAFICVHNSCRSQIAEALAKRYYSEFFDAYSAGTEIKSQINQDAVRIMKSQFDIDMEENQYSKLIDVLPPIDIVVTMGCNVNCPYLPCRHREDWGLDDPSGKNDDAFLETISQIQKKLETLADSMK